MNKDIYERMILTVTEFDTEDIIVTSGEQPSDIPPLYQGSEYEAGSNTGSLPYGF